MTIGEPHPLESASRWERGWYVFRRVTIFLLGTLVILDSLFEKDTATVGKLIVGMVMVGVLPLEDLIRAAIRVRRLGTPEPPKPQ